MSFIRFTPDLAIPVATWNALPTATRTTIRNKIQQLKSYAVKINEGLPNEEDTTKAVYHICHHDTGETCEPEQDI